MVAEWCSIKSIHFWAFKTRHSVSRFSKGNLASSNVYITCYLLRHLLELLFIILIMDRNYLRLWMKNTNNVSLLHLRKHTGIETNKSWTNFGGGWRWENIFVDKLKIIRLKRSIWNLLQEGEHIPHDTHVHQRYRVTETLPVDMETVGHHFSHLCDGFTAFKLQATSSDPGDHRSYWQCIMKVHQKCGWGFKLFLERGGWFCDTVELAWNTGSTQVHAQITSCWMGRKLYATN